jgi:flavin-dependent dehydrogenase
MPNGFDVAIVGARVAGSTAASMLGDAGLHVLLVDAASFPSDTISTHFFRGAGFVSVLDRLGVLDEVLSLGPPKLTCEYLFETGAAVPAVGDPQTPGAVGYSLSVRRLALDRILLERARRTPNVEVWESTSAREMTRNDDGRVTGLIVERDGRRDRVDASLVVGADGRGSFVARQVGAEVVRREAASRAMYFRYVRGYAPIDGRPDGPDFSFNGDELVYAFPSDDDVTCIALSINLTEFERFRAAPEAGFTERVSAHPGIAERFRAAEPISRLLGSGPKDAIVRAASGPGWALVGDAGLHQDPWTGFGMDNASIQAALLAESTVDWLTGGVGEARAFHSYERRRNEHALPGFDFTAEGGRDLTRVG